MTDRKYYVHFEKKSGQILGVSNYLDDSFENNLPISFEEAEPFITGSARTKDFIIGYKRDEKGKNILAIVPISDQGYSFKNNVFEWITETTDPVECTVTWNGAGKRWEFSIEKRIIDYYDVAAAPKLIFFVTLESDFDFLVRTIVISMHDIILSDLNYIVPFVYPLESKIDKISISSKLVFKSYGLRIVNG